jgi:hypothetical protein
MNLVFAWAGFLGAWLLVAGPLYQGAIELLEADIDRDAIEQTTARLPRPDPPSPWWWLRPPVMYLIRHSRGKAYKRAALARLAPAQREQFASFLSKATGWFTVAVGATLLAIDQTWQVIDRYHWPMWLFWLLIVVMLGSSVLNTSGADEPRPEGNFRGAAGRRFTVVSIRGSAGYGRERRGRNLIQASTATATSSQGENRMWAAKPRTARATRATRTATKMAGMVIGLL